MRLEGPEGAARLIGNVDVPSEEGDVARTNYYIGCLACTNWEAWVERARVTQIGQSGSFTGTMAYSARGLL